jgi:hypothetical protein
MASMRLVIVKKKGGQRKAAYNPSAGGWLLSAWTEYGQPAGLTWPLSSTYLFGAEQVSETFRSRHPPVLAPFPKGNSVRLKHSTALFLHPAPSDIEVQWQLADSCPFCRPEGRRSGVLAESLPELAVDAVYAVPRPKFSCYDIASL